ncbi:MAG: hypothetical protein KGP28_07375 [Bdellovibrionales bacterium]|nr:hypothetical protein [Bdellovibrionales bacterium]
MKSFYLIPFFTFLSSCSVLVGQVKPIEEKSVNPPTPAHSLEAMGWQRIDPRNPSERSSEVPDEAWQSRATAAVISLNSVCRSGLGGERDIKKVTKVLLSQWDNLKIEHQASFEFRNLPGLQTTARGKYLGRDRKFQIMVVKSPACIYDLVYLSPVESFEQELSAFARFRDTLELK